MKKHYSFIIASLLVSLFIYLFYRTDKTLINEVVIRTISFDNYASLRQAVNRFLPLNEFVIYSLPEGLWAFCITLTSRPYYIQQKNRRINCQVVPLICCIGLEIAQLLHVTKGRFDLMDIWATVIFWFIATFAFDDKQDKQNILMPINGRRMVCFISYGIVYLSHVLE
ncbi:hypothetical protein [Spirosoma endbachense]|uniref:Uncharacterized protein n=1 Tax=Spirosoma endbachense TaxID=2666025 RepID=A0A6P1W4B4_9BACT|nr:hypothetical protein [Spirosoma endbachense]QHV99734.1 hypothetical protein GJR95_34080 [Spirosoma endbachense]